MRGIHVHLLSCAVRIGLPTLALGVFSIFPLVAQANEEKEVSFDASQLPPTATTPIDFARDIQPILEGKCYSCHGPKKQKGGLRLDYREGVLSGGDSGKIVELGHSDTSDVIRRVSGLEPDDVMPPKGDLLTPEEVGLLRAWIDGELVWTGDGATGVPKVESDHWAFQPVERPEVPAGNDWVRNPIDAFVADRLEKEGFEPSPEADRVTLMRRLHMDLTGLPPTPEDVDTYLADTSEHAYERLVNRLLASPHFGERWGRHWLDVARYADTDGFEKDTPRPHAWRWRNWVIDALNRDMPYDQFVIEQLAGDLLPNATTEQIVATGFHRNTLTNREGGVDQEQFRVEQVVDRTNTTGAVFLGLTMACAQCHTHKYDPITQREYYGLYSFFNSGIEKDIPAPLPGEVTAYKRAKSEWDARAEAVRKAVDVRKKELSAGLAEWEAGLELPNKGWTVLEPTSFASLGGSTFDPKPDQSILVTGTRPDTDQYTVIGRTRETGLIAVRLEALTDQSLRQTGPGRATNGNFVLSEFTLHAASMEDPHKKTPIKFKSAQADFEEPGREAAQAIDGETLGGWAIYREVGMNESRVITFLAEEPFGYQEGTILTFDLDHRYGRQHAIGRFRLSVTPADPTTITLPDNTLAALRTPAAERTPKQQDVVLEHFAALQPDVREKMAVLEGLMQIEPVKDKTQAQTIAANPDPPNTYIHVRGDFLTKGDEVQSHTPGVLPAFDGSSASPTRLDLARWIVSDENPLTPRVQANRIWSNLFGEGLVRTPEDFGTRGEQPTHPALMDWLASEMMAGGWSTKDMIRLIATSATYRQASHTRPELNTVDAQNRLLARQNRFRVEAEITRDVYLASSGLLHSRIGGPSVRPPLPPGIAALGYGNSVKWAVETDEDKYRRGLYIFFQRTVPYPMLMAFDCPDSNTTNVRRNRSNTPLQALTLLNDTVFFECAQALGERVLAETPADDAERIRHTFRLCMAREPSEAELARLQELLKDQRERFAAEPEAALRFAALEAPADGAAENPEAIEKAAHIALARVIMNLDEFVTRE
jgi:mono/diheme cytochrome c family protein